MIGCMRFSILTPYVLQKLESSEESPKMIRNSLFPKILTVVIRRISSLSELLSDNVLLDYTRFSYSFHLQRDFFR